MRHKVKLLRETGCIDVPGTLFLMRPGEMEKVKVILHIGPADDPAPVLTLMLPEDE